MTDDFEAPARRPRPDPGARVAPRQVVVGVDGMKPDDGVETEERPRRELRPRWVVTRLAAVLLVAAAVVSAPATYLSLRTREWRHSVNDAPASRVALVMSSPGAGDSVVENLVATAGELRTRRLVRDVVLAGPSFGAWTDTPSDFAAVDAAPTTFYEMCDRTATAHLDQPILLVVERRDLDRALYACREQGLAVHGVGVGGGPGWAWERASDSVRTIWRAHLSRPGLHRP